MHLMGCYAVATFCLEFPASRLAASWTFGIKMMPLNKFNVFINLSSLAPEYNPCLEALSDS